MRRSGPSDWREVDDAWAANDDFLGPCAGTGCCATGLAGTSSPTAAWASARWRWARCSAPSRLGRGGRSRAAASRPTAPHRAGATIPSRPGRGISRAGAERHLSVHGRRSQPARAVRLQAPASGVQRPADPGLVHPGPAVRLHGYVHQGASEAAGDDSASSRGTASRVRGSRSCCRTSAEVVDDLTFVKSAATDVFNHAPAKLFANTGTVAVRPAEHGLVGHLRDRQRVVEPARVRGAAIGPARARAAGRSTGLAGSCRRLIRGCRSRSGGDPILNLATPAGHLARPPATDDRDDRGAQPGAARRHRRPRDRDADQCLRGGLPDADQRHRS